MLRNLDGFVVTEGDVRGLAAWDATKAPEKEIPFMPGRVVLQDFTGVLCVVDLAAIRDGVKKLGGDPNVINPLVKCDLVIDHSVQVDAFGSRGALKINSDREFERNNERYRFLKWGLFLQGTGRASQKRSSTRRRCGVRTSLQPVGQLGYLHETCL